METYNRAVAVTGVFARAAKGRKHTNTGNLMHAVAGRRLLQTFSDFPTHRIWTDEELERIRGDNSHVVLVAANALRIGVADSDVAPIHKVLSDNIIAAKLPVVVLGLGSQAPLHFEGSVLLPESTKQLVAVLGEHSENIGVRGTFTAEILSDLGVKNVWVTGCPSCFWHHSPHFTPNLTHPVAATAKVAFGYTGPWQERYLLQLAQQGGLDMIGQQQFVEEHIRDGNPGAPDYADGLKKVFSENLVSQNDYESYVKEHFYQFYDLNEWMDALTRYDFAFGTRFHGNMAALQSGVRTLWVVHDKRTEELCAALHLPNVRISEINGETALEELIERADYGDFVRHYPAVYGNFVDYLNASGLPHRMQPAHAYTATAPNDGFGEFKPSRLATRILLRTQSSVNDQLACLTSQTIEMSNAIARIGRMAEGRQRAALDPNGSVRVQGLLGDRYDYIPPGLSDPNLLPHFPSLAEQDATKNRWPFLRREVPHVFRTDVRSKVANIGVISKEEAVILHNLAKHFSGLRALEIGCHLAWSSAHILAAGVRLDIVDPRLEDGEHGKFVRDSLTRAVPNAAYKLWSGFSPSIIDAVAATSSEPWSFVFIDGNHDGIAPVNDSLAVIPHCADTACVVFHDLVAPPVAAGLEYFRKQGWNTRIYNTMQVLGIAWRGDFTPFEHIADENVPQFPQPYAPAPARRVKKRPTTNTESSPIGDEAKEKSRHTLARDRTGAMRIYFNSKRKLDELDNRYAEIYEAVRELGRLTANRPAKIGSAAPSVPIEAIDLATTIQVRNNTEYDRYPQIFAQALHLARTAERDEGVRVLSFGCSSGDEVFTLAQDYFDQKTDQLIGVDISDVHLATARSNNKFGPRVIFKKSSNDVVRELGPYDLVFAMSVLCVWPDTKDMEDISSVFPFSKFEAMLQILDDNLRAGGYLVLYNANFCFADSAIAARYDKIDSADVQGSGFVKKFEKSNRAYPEDFEYHDVIFRKRAPQ